MRRSAMPSGTTGGDWWRAAVFYQICVRSFADSDADGIGDLEGIRSRLGYLELLGVDALWLTPFYRSPMAEGGYDVVDPRTVDPLFGDLDAVDRLVADAHDCGIRVTLSLVPNHTSRAHPWFEAALRAGPGSPERGRYHFRPGRGPQGAAPPNNWRDVLGGPAWTPVGDGEWYLHLFGPEQPDLNWAAPEVGADLARTMRFWLDRGIDGFHIDTAHGMAKPPDLPDRDPGAPDAAGRRRDNLTDPRFDDEGVHEIHRMIGKVLDEYPGALACGDIRVVDDARFARYLRPGELRLGHHHLLEDAAFDADAVRSAIERSLRAVQGSGTLPTWMLSNQDVVRHVTRYGDGARGVQRARAMTLVQLALPGTVCLYNGEELGLPNAGPDREGCQVPIPWEGAAPPFGFSTGEASWLPVPPEWVDRTVEAQLEDADSTLSLYRAALEIRGRHPGFAGDEVEWYGAPPGCFALRRKGGGLVCALNTSPALVPLPPGEILLTSQPLVDGELPPDAAVWLI